MIHISTETWPLTDEFRRSWNRLYEQTAARTPFMRLEWIETGLEIYAGKAQIIPCTWRGAGEEVVAAGIFLLVSEKGRLGYRRILRTVEYNSQRIVPLLASDDISIPDAIEILMARFSGRVDYFDCFKIDAELSGMDSILATCRERGQHVSAQCFNEQPQFVFTGSWEHYLSERTQGHRKKIRRYMRKLEEAYPDYTFSRIRGCEDTDTGEWEVLLERIMRFFDSSWQAETLASGEHDALQKLKQFYRRLAVRCHCLGIMEICTLTADSTLLAFEYNLVEENRVYMLFGAYNADYARHSPGNAILAEIIRDGFDQGDRYLEFGGEHLDYKRLWTKVSTKSYHLRFYGKTLRGRVKGRFQKDVSGDCMIPSQ